MMSSKRLSTRRSPQLLLRAPQNKNKREAFALLEIIIVIALMAMLSIAAWKFESGGAGSGTPPPTVQQGQGDVLRARAVQGLLNTKSAADQNSLDQVSK